MFLLGSKKLIILFILIYFSINFIFIYFINIINNYYFFHYVFIRE